jgi:hypothetical protein
VYGKRYRAGTVYLDKHMNKAATQLRIGGKRCGRGEERVFAHERKAMQLRIGEKRCDL